ncbi:hypothetical protein [Amycolatopsis aidingensis]|uniref:hypothetical protein n=1 Tax=Amycolatopsis aidingensis TaxID=2842453 RepID=UPI001C0C2E97|nr:hypothetical protein [Amycolatopsis aidingensis]
MVAPNEAGTGAWGHRIRCLAAWLDARGLFRRWSVTLQVALVLALALGAVTTMTVGLAGGLGASGALLLANLCLALRARRTPHGGN